MSTPAASAPARPARLTEVALVAAGGALGTLARAAVGLLPIPGPSVVGAVSATLIVNLLGSFLMGLLVGRLSRRPPTRRTLAVRAGLGTGFLGGFTTYSAYVLATTGWAISVWWLFLLLWLPVVACAALALWGLRIGGGRPPEVDA